MPKWSEMLARLIPWFDNHDADESQRFREESCAQRLEQELLSPIIDEQTQYLVRRGSLNGFTAQLRTGIARRATGD